MNTNRLNRVSIGDPVKIVPIGDFNKIPSDELGKLWEVIGPTVEANINNQPLWKVFAVCYAQGLENGAALKNEV